MVINNVEMIVKIRNGSTGTHRREFYHGLHYHHLYMVYIQQYELGIYFFACIQKVFFKIKNNRIRHLIISS